MSADLIEHRFINSSATLVKDTLLGITSCDPNLGLLNYGNVVVCRNYAKNDIVKIISGGASGHEPSHAGFVGKGMLTAAVQGEFCHSPLVSEILNAIKEISYKLLEGVLVIIQNNVSDRLNFGLAVERARSQGIDVKMVIVNDDFCIVNTHQGRRGLAGIILVNKIAGAMANEKIDLETIYKFCQRLVLNMSTILFELDCAALSSEECICTKEMNPNKMVISTGLITIEKLSAKDTSQFVLKQLTNHFTLDSSMHVVVLVNNLGNALLSEELIFTKEVVNHLHERQIAVSRVYHGKFFTLDMRGFSLTLLKAFDDEIFKYLDYYCEASAWGYVNKNDITKNFENDIVCRVSKRKRATNVGPHLSDEQANAIFFAVQFACSALITCEKQINILDSDCGGGNVGTKITCGAQAVLQKMEHKLINFSHPKCFFETLSEISEKTVAGAIGAFYGILFEAAGNYFRELPDIYSVDFDVWVKCLAQVNLVLKSYGNTDFGCATMYDPLHACAETLGDCLQRGISCMAAFALAVKSIKYAVMQTKQGYRQCVDPGARVVEVWMTALHEGFQLQYD